MSVGYSSVNIPIGLSDIDPTGQHLFFTTPLEEFTVVEGLLLLLLCSFGLYCFYRVLMGRR